MTLPHRATTEVRQLIVRGRRFATANAASFAAAVVALSMAGVLTVAKSAQFAIGGPVVPTADVNPHSSPTTGTAPVVPAPLAPAPVARAPVAITAAPSGAPVTAKKTAAFRDAATPPATRPPAAGQTASLDVVHLHRFGDCRGRLQVSSDGVAFVTDEKDDAFTLPFAEFLHAVSDDTLTLRSAAKTYRFKPVGAGGDSTRTLREFADRISRARR